MLPFFFTDYYGRSEVVVDVIIEGKITSEEGVDEVLKTCAEIKSVKTPILRINDNGSELQGQIAFSQGGYIIGGKVNQTGEVGYAAVRKLLMIEDGNYAILDPLRKHITDVNQSLWIKVDKLVPLLPNLPESPEGLLDKQPEVAQTIHHKTGQVDIASGLPSNLDKNDDLYVAPAPVTPKNKSRKFNLGAWRIFRAGMLIIMGFTSMLAAFTYRDEVIQFFNKIFGAH